MLIGAMNHPERPILGEIEWMAELGMQFMDLTLEPPAAASWRVNIAEVRNALEKHGMTVVGHTAWYLPVASAIPELREAAFEELKRCMERFSEVGAQWMNVHPDRNTPWHPREYYIQGNVDTLGRLLQVGKKYGVGVMVENLPGEYNSAQQLGELLQPLPELGLHLDIGHANLQVPHNTTCEILEQWGTRLRHVHLHDNKGGHADLHLPLGTGTVDVKAAVEALKQCGYDGTVTLEVFSPDQHHLTYSRDLLRDFWSNGAHG
jgi:sugar phosphate isomerase/epimerase